VALARALVAEAGLLLFDEPLSNLDARLREDLRAELHALHARLVFTSVYVTHDLTEALALGDRVAVMDSGRIVQMGAPSEVFEHPASLIVANLVGLRRFATVTKADGAWRGPFGASELGRFLPEDLGEASVFAWPDRMHIFSEPAAAPEDHLCVSATVADVSYMGSDAQVSLTTEAGTLRVVRGRHETNLFHPGDRVAVSVPREDLRCFDASGTAIELRKAQLADHARLAKAFASNHKLED
jgi:iron(III) transport system ATP-binding protein